ncbi:hypothetical protein CJ030_MR1G027863 [Morella rubra]|uniref:Uncharacterized protein n=1 Tax=Morella rubra TaxID=262757 RepID=A0A6A1WMV0_9ROSI|nr:hypothetical protein CJ030_MR1G027863 [Morella rubra]
MNSRTHHDHEKPILAPKENECNLKLLLIECDKHSLARAHVRIICVRHFAADS